MFRLFIVLVFFFSSLCAFSRSVADIPDETFVENTLPFDPDIESIIDSMTLEQKAGQLFLVGFNGQEVTAGAAQIINHIKPGGLIFFGRNIETARQISRLIYQSQITAKEAGIVPLFTAVDQEGGVVSRIKINPPIPSAMAIGSGGDRSLTERMGLYTGILLKSLGFNMNLAPVVDLVDEKNSSFIGNRAFNTDPGIAIEMAKSFSYGLKLAGIIPTFKHFPGHGPSFTDSHLALPYRMDTLEELERRDLIPFSDLDQKIMPEAVMVAHIAFPKIDPTRQPATFSPIFLQNILRKKLNFNGIIITDDIEMRAANVNNQPLKERALRSILAGADMIMIAWNKNAQKASVDSIVSAVNSGKISVARIDSSLRRILSAKKRLGILLDPLPANLREFRSLLVSRSISDFSDRILRNVFQRASAGFTFSDGRYSQKLLVFSSRRAFHSNFKEKYLGQTGHYGLPAIRSGFIQKELTRNKSYLALVHVTSNQVTRALASVSPSLRSRILLINGDSPGIIDNPEKYRFIFNIYSPDSRIGEIAGQFLNEKLNPQSLPMRLPSSTQKF